MSDPLGKSETPPVRRRRRRWPYVVAALSLPVLAAVGVWVYLTVAADWALKAAIADADRRDPRWRLEEIEADRAAVPDAENSATPVMAAKALLPKDWPVWDAGPPPQDPKDAAKRQALADGFNGLEPQQQLNDEETTALRAEMARAAGALAEARKLAGLPAGRYPITYSQDYISTLLPHTQDARALAYLLAMDAMLRSQDKDSDGALASCRGILNAGRSIGDEPLLISQLVRIACRVIAVRQAERVLAQGEASDDALKQFQDLLKKEEPAPLFLMAARGERAGMDRLMEAVQSGKVKMSARDLLITARFGGQSAPSLGEEIALWTPGFMASQRAAMLHNMNEAVELAQLPPEQRHASFRQLEATHKDQPILVHLLAPALGKVSDAAQRSQAQLRCAIAATAAERYRRAKGQWPDSLDALRDAGYLRGPLTDPYDGQPLRWRRLNDGLVIYTLGPDGVDDGGKMDRQNPNTPGTDIGFRLWDVGARRQPPAPLAQRPAVQRAGGYRLRRRLLRERIHQRLQH